MSGNETKSSESDTDELLESLKTILQAKTANLEQALSDEPTNIASKLFDTIYESDKPKKTTASDESQSVRHTSQVTTKKAENSFSDESKESPLNLVVNETDNADLKTLSSAVNKYKEGNVELSDEKVANEKGQTPVGLNDPKVGKMEKFRDPNITGKILTSLGGMENTTIGNRPQDTKNYVSLSGKETAGRKDTSNNTAELKSVFMDDNEERVLEKEDERSSSEIDRQDPILNVPFSTETKSTLTSDKVMVPNHDHSVIFPVEYAFETNKTRKTSHKDWRNPETHHISEKNDTRWGSSIMGKILYDQEQQSDLGEFYLRILLKTIVE